MYGKLVVYSWYMYHSLVSYDICCQKLIVVMVCGEADFWPVSLGVTAEEDRDSCLKENP